MSAFELEIGLVIQDLAEKKRLQRKDVAECLGVTTNNIQKQYERRKLDIDKMEKLSILTGVNLFDLYSTQESLRGLDGEAKWLRGIIRRLQARLEENAVEIERLRRDVARAQHSEEVAQEALAYIKELRKERGDI